MPVSDFTGPQALRFRLLTNGAVRQDRRVHFTLAKGPALQDYWAEDGTTLGQMLGDLGLPPNQGSNESLRHGALVRVSGNQAGIGPAPPEDVGPGGWRLVRLGSAWAGQSLALRSADAPVRAGPTRRGKVTIGRSGQVWLGRVRQSRHGPPKVRWRRLRWQHRCSAGTVLRTTNGAVFALVQEPVGPAAKDTVSKRNWTAAASAAITGVIMAAVMLLVTGNPLWAAMPFAGVVATALPLALRRRRPPWLDSVAGLDPKDGGITIDGPVELIGSPQPVAALARRLITEAFESSAMPPSLEVPPEPAWAWARFAAAASPALMVSRIAGGLRIDPGPDWPDPGTAGAASRDSPGPRFVAGRWMVKDAGMGLLAARATGREPFRAAAVGKAAAESLIRHWACGAPVAAAEEPFPLTAEAIAANWCGGVPLPTIGRNEDGGAIRVDLARDGPHVLVAGTSGSGKSEFLRALMLSECVTTSPDQLIIVGIDHKGGATFRDLERLPHVVGVATDLDALGTSRVLTSLEAELAGRERLLERHSATAWRELPDEVRPARLLVVVDEFRTLLDALPAAAGRLERLAAQGRSLGIALVLATQRPAGAVSAQLRANLALRVCFRVATEADSLDILGSADAARLDPAKPGSCIVASAGRPPCRLRVRMLPPSPRRRCAKADWPDLWQAPGPVSSSPAALVTAISQAAAAMGATIPSPPWLPPLPQRLQVSQIKPPGPGHHGAVTLGLADLPELQRQEPLVWEPASGHLAILGGPHSGRTTAAVTAASGLAATGWMTHVITNQVPAYRGLLSLPGFGSLVDARAAERVCELLAAIGREQVALILDAAAELEAYASPALSRPLLDALVQGSLVPAAVLVVTAPAKPARWLSLCPHRLVLPVTDLTEALTLGLPRDLATSARVAGRACYLGGGNAIMAQIALPPCGAGQRSPHAAALEPPVKVLPLPERVTADDLPADTGSGVWIGLGGRHGCPLGLPLRPGEPVGVIGPSGSGRSTTLAAIHHRLENAGRESVMFGSGCRRSWEDILAALITGQVVLADDIESVSGQPPSSLPPRGTLVASCTTAWAAAFRPPMNLFHANPLGLLLWPGGRSAAAAFGPSANPGPPLDLSAPVQAAPPGRGRLILGSRSHAIQVAAL